MGGRGVCVGVRIMRLRRWRGRKLENASLICLQANDVSPKKRLDVPQYTKLCGKIPMEIGTSAMYVQASQLPEYSVQSQPLFLEQQERRSETPGTVTGTVTGTITGSATWGCRTSVRRICTDAV
jgi:hypothetical protein